MRWIVLGAAVAGIVAVAVAYSYALEQTKERGFEFGNDLSLIQDDLKALQEGFETQKIILEEGDISEAGLIEYTRGYVAGLEEILQRYGALDTPAAFISSVEFFRLSTASQIDSAEEFLAWLESGDMSHLIRSDALFQESFEYELAALSHFNAAKSGRDP